MDRDGQRWRFTQLTKLCSISVHFVSIWRYFKVLFDCRIETLYTLYHTLTALLVSSVMIPRNTMEFNNGILSLRCRQQIDR